MNQGDCRDRATGLAFFEIPNLPHLVRHVRKAEDRLAPRFTESVESGCLHLYRENTLCSAASMASGVSLYGASVVQDVPRSTGVPNCVKAGATAAINAGSAFA